MRHKYETRGIVLARTPLREANVSLAVLTEDLGLVRAHAQGLRKTGAKLAASLATFAESSLVLVRGKEEWRVAGAVLERSWFAEFAEADARRGAARVSGLLLRLVAGEGHPELFAVIAGFFGALAALPRDSREAAEALAVLRILSLLGLDAGEVPGGVGGDYAPEHLAAIAADRGTFVNRVNRGIVASGL